MDNTTVATVLLTQRDIDALEHFFDVMGSTHREGLVDSFSQEASDVLRKPSDDKLLEVESLVENFRRMVQDFDTAVNKIKHHM